VYWTNEELNNLNQDTDIVIDIKTRRLKWLGQTVRMEINRIPKVAEMLNWRVKGRLKDQS
jgi:hypothetical protein